MRWRGTDRYPGPVHVIELAEPLQLSVAQRQHVQQLFEAMKGEAVSIGKRLIAQESALDRAFAERNINSTPSTRTRSAVAGGLARAAGRENSPTNLTPYSHF